MTKLTNAQILEAAAAQVRKHFADVESARNKKMRDEIALALTTDKNVQRLFIAQSVNVAELTDLYNVHRVIRFFKEISADTFDVAKCDENMTVVVKTLINAKAIDETVTKADVEDAIIRKNENARKHVYQRKVKISEARQVQMCLSAIKLANLQDRATLKARDCEALKIATEKLKDIAL